MSPSKIRSKNRAPPPAGSWRAPCHRGRERERERDKDSLTSLKRNHFANPQLVSPGLSCPDSNRRFALQLIGHIISRYPSGDESDVSSVERTARQRRMLPTLRGLGYLRACAAGRPAPLCARYATEARWTIRRTVPSEMVCECYAELAQVAMRDTTTLRFANQRPALRQHAASLVSPHTTTDCPFPASCSKVVILRSCCSHDPGSETCVVEPGLSTIPSPPPFTWRKRVSARDSSLGVLYLSGSRSTIYPEDRRQPGPCLELETRAWKTLRSKGAPDDVRPSQFLLEPGGDTSSRPPLTGPNIDEMHAPYLRHCEQKDSPPPYQTCSLASRPL